MDMVEFDDALTTVRNENPQLHIVGASKTPECWVFDWRPSDWFPLIGPGPIVVGKEDGVVSFVGSSWIPEHAEELVALDWQGDRPTDEELSERGLTLDLLMLEFSPAGDDGSLDEEDTVEEVDGIEAKAGEQLPNFFESLFKQTLSALNIDGDQVASAAMGVRDAVAGGAAAAGAAFVDGARAAFDGAGHLASGAGEALGAAGQAISNGANSVADKAKEAFEGSPLNVSEEDMEQVLAKIYGDTLNGIPKISRSLEDMVQDYLEHSDSVQSAAEQLIATQVIKCGTSGFVTGLGGLITLPVSIPANVGSVLYVQMRMIAALAMMGGFDVRSDQVQTLVYACLTGSAVSDILKQAGIKIGEKIAYGLVKKIPGKVLSKINKAVAFRLITKFGTKGIINLGQLVPVLGGIVGGAFDVATTRIIAANAYSFFIDKVVPEDKALDEAQVEVLRSVNEKEDRIKFLGLGSLHDQEVDNVFEITDPEIEDEAELDEDEGTDRSS